jgi:geranylgeranyl diphosphate synthase type II
MTMSSPSAPVSLAAEMARLVPLVDEALDRYTDLPQCPDPLHRVCPAALRDAMRYALLAPGKRLRPLLVLLAAEACGGAAQAALPAACAVEMIHAYSLVHDDLPAMDDDDLRRGRPTCHKVYGEALAILVGDALQALAFEVLAREVTPPEAAARCCAVLAQAAGAAALVGGQADDLASSAQSPAGEHGAALHGRLVAIHARKTAALFAASAVLGGVCAGAGPEQLHALEVFGHQLGMAFQILDDVLDVAGDESQVGKRLGKDAAQGKLTYPAVLGVAASRQDAQSRVQLARQALHAVADRAESLDALCRFVLERDR